MATYVRTQSIDHPIGASGRVTLGVTSADVGVEAVDGDTARMRATFEIRAGSDAEADSIFDAAKLRVSVSSDSVELQEPDERHAMRHGVIGALPRLFGGSDGVELEIHLEVPHGAELRLATVSGDVNIRGLVGDQRYQTVSGDLSLVDAGGVIRVNTVSGDARLRGDGSVVVRAESVSGDVAVSAPHLVAVRAQTVSGDVEVEGELEPSGEFRAETVSGDLVVGLVGSATFEVRGLSTDISSDIDHRVEGRHDRRRLVVGSGTPVFTFSSMSGDLAVRRPRRLGGIPQPPQPPSAPSPPAAPRAPLSPDQQLSVLQALERGEIDIDEATRRLAGEDR
ncbi:MAG: DUF4097 family beta strand repeat-containing protein [Chloroflexota bacterium]